MPLNQPLAYLPPDLTHDASNLILRTYPVRAAMRVLTKLMGNLPYRPRLVNRVLDSPVGIGAGVDKDGLLVGLMANLPVGFHTIGSVTLRPRRGNPRPRMRRYPGLKAMVNAMGLPSRGFWFIREVLNGECPRWPRGKLLGISLAGFSEVEFKIMLDSLTPYLGCVDFIEINVSSPTYGGSWVEPQRLSNLLKLLKRHDKVVVKVPLLPNVNDEVKVLKTIINHNPLGLTIANTIMVKSDLSVGYGGVSGAPLLKIVTRLIKLTRGMGYGGLIIGLGGFMSGGDVLRGLGAGADLVGMVTAFAMEGPLSVYRVVNELRKLIAQRQLNTLNNPRRDSWQLLPIPDPGGKLS